MGGITIIGLGPGSPDLITREAWTVLSNAENLFVRTAHHPVVDHLPGTLAVHAFDHYYDEFQNFEDVYTAITEYLLEQARAGGQVLYAVPGDPTLGEATVPKIRQGSEAAGIPLRIINGVSFIEPCLELIQVDGLDGITILDALELVQLHHPPINPDLGVLIGQLFSKGVASDVKLTLMNQYPDEYPVILIHGASTPRGSVEELPLYEIDRSHQIDVLSALYIPPMPSPASFEAFQNTIAHLRAPEGCPWDREQTHQSLRAHLLEETYEALEAIDESDTVALAEELGDLLLQIVLQAQIAVEAGEFRMDEVISSINRKLIQRHPHVFGDLDLGDVGQVLKNWEHLKAQERGTGEEAEGLMDGVPTSLPALSQAYELQGRAARVGFDWPKVEGVLEKIAEEIAEIQQATKEQAGAEIGDLLFALVNYARWRDVDPESELRHANHRFRRRFSTMIAKASQTGRSFRELALSEMEEFWQAAKQDEV